MILVINSETTVGVITDKRKVMLQCEDQTPEAVEKLCRALNASSTLVQEPAQRTQRIKKTK